MSNCKERMYQPIRKIGIDLGVQFKLEISDWRDAYFDLLEKEDLKHQRLQVKPIGEKLSSNFGRMFEDGELVREITGIPDVWRNPREKFAVEMEILRRSTDNTKLRIYDVVGGGVFLGAKVNQPESVSVNSEKLEFLEAYLEENEKQKYLKMLVPLSMMVVKPDHEVAIPKISSRSSWLLRMLMIYGDEGVKVEDVLKALNVNRMDGIEDWKRELRVMMKESNLLIGDCGYMVVWGRAKTQDGEVLTLVMT